MQCRLCNGNSQKFQEWNERVYLQCLNCNSIFLQPTYFLKPSEEKIRYLVDNNNVTNKGYQDSVSLILVEILKDQNTNCLGLDYGCGMQPVAADHLKKEGFKINLYDPFFENHPEYLEQYYDFIICCEGMEHFKSPSEEFKNLNNLLKPGGNLYCKTSLYSKKIDFQDWHYKNDSTHVFLYTEESLHWIKDKLNFSKIRILQDLIIFKK